jgi:hypothetical protein
MVGELYIWVIYCFRWFGFLRVISLSLGGPYAIVTILLSSTWESRQGRNETSMSVVGNCMEIETSGTDLGYVFIAAQAIGVTGG